MRNTDFLKMRERLEESCKQIMIDKGDVYIRGTDDRFANFRRCAEDMGCSIQKAWGIYFHKHVDAIFHYIKTGQEGPEGVLENIKDARNYLDLLAGIVVEGAPTPPEPIVVFQGKEIELPPPYYERWTTGATAPPPVTKTSGQSLPE